MEEKVVNSVKDLTVVLTELLYIHMHSIQEKLLSLAESTDLSGMSLRDIGKLVGEPHPEKIRHHLGQLAKRGMLWLDRERGTQRIERQGEVRDGLISVPIIGSANCGVAEIFADQNIEGFLRISSRILIKKDQVFIIRAVGSSMNRANIRGERIDDGDYVVVDASRREPKNGEYVVSVIDDMANIKRFYRDESRNVIALISESSTPYQPIYVHGSDEPSYRVAGTVIQVIKQPEW